jgi:hypothetical protein
MLRNKEKMVKFVFEDEDIDSAINLLEHKGKQSQLQYTYYT